MKITIEFNNLAKAPLKKGFFAAVAGNIFQEPDWNFLEKKNIIISVAVVGEGEMRRLNNQYRHKDSVTDVLSFAEFEKTANIKEVKDKEIYLGELTLCHEDIKKYARAEKKDLKKELAAVCAHGVLHLLGLRHGKKMFALQARAVKSLN